MQEELEPVEEESKKDLMVVVYLPKKIEGYGPLDGSAPGPVA